MAVANAALPALIGHLKGALAYAVVIGAGTGCLVALVLPLATAALADTAALRPSAAALPHAGRLSVGSANAAALARCVCVRGKKIERVRKKEGDF